jgi:hypothetical protein
VLRDSEWFPFSLLHGRTRGRVLEEGKGQPFTLYRINLYLVFMGKQRFLCGAVVLCDYQKQTQGFIKILISRPHPELLKDMWSGDLSF